MAGDAALSDLRAWLDLRTAAAPAALRQCLLEHADAAPAGAPDAPSRLAGAARHALDVVAAHPGDRSVALDLLAADGLITLALLRQAEEDPAGLARFARALTEPAGG
jgi:hypothetical protein